MQQAVLPQVVQEETLLPFSQPFVTINEDKPFFETEDLEAQSRMQFGALDYMGRVTGASAIVSVDTLPESEREPIDTIKPTGWRNQEYDFIEGGWVYNRCHLIAFQLSAQNANAKNLVTGTRSMNVDGMLPFENQIAAYIRSTQNHVALRVTPLFEKVHSLCYGVLMEAWSIEDNGTGICFNVFCFNKQAGVLIDYDSGQTSQDPSVHLPSLQPETQEEPEAPDSADSLPAQVQSEEASFSYVLNTNTHRFHRPDCPSVAEIKDKNRQDYNGSRQTLLDEGFVPCKRCNP